MSQKGSKGDPIELEDTDDGENKDGSHLDKKAIVAIPLPDSDEEEDMLPLHTSLESLENRVAERYAQQARKAADMKVKRETERAHSQYLCQTIGISPDSKYAANFWTQRNNKKVPGFDGVQRSSSSRPLQESMSSLSKPQRSRMLHCRNQIDNCPPTVQYPPADIPTINIHERCKVGNCEIEFSSLDGYWKHMDDNKHSPCLPTRHLLDGVCRMEHQQYCCPICGLIFESGMECEDHMRLFDHITLQEPLLLGGYMCSSCLLVFPSNTECMLHKHKHDHFKAVDLRSEGSGRPQNGATAARFKMEDREPVPLPEAMLARFLACCHKVKSRVECAQCLCYLKTCAECSSHVEKQHCVVAYAESSRFEVIKSFLCEYTCIQCLRLYPKLPAAGLDAIHSCCDTLQGMLVEYEFETFKEFILRCSMSHIPLENAHSSASTSVDEGLDFYVCNPGSISKALPSSSHRSPTQSTAMYSGVRTGRPRLGKPGSDQSDSRILRTPRGERRKLTSPAASSSSEVPRAPKRSIDSDEEDDSEIQKEKSLKTPRKRMKVCKDRKHSGKKNSQLSKVQRKMGGLNIKEGGEPVLKYPCGTVHLDLDSPPQRGSDTKCDSGGCGGAANNRTGENIQRSSKGHHEASAAASCSPEEASKCSKLTGDRDGSGTSAQRCVTLPPGRSTQISDGTPSNLKEMNHIVFVDLDNWACLFKRLPMPLPDKTFVWGFSGGNTVWKEPQRCHAFEVTKASGCFFLQKCGNTKNAADFAICLQVGRLDERLPCRIPFTILSGDGGFNELETIMANSKRLFKVTNPHHTPLSEVYALIISLADT